MPTLGYRCREPASSRPRRYLSRGKRPRPCADRHSQPISGRWLLNISSAVSATARKNDRRRPKTKATPFTTLAISISDKLCRSEQSRGIGTKGCKCIFGLNDQHFEAGFCAHESENADHCCFTGCFILLGSFADDGGIALNVQKIVSDLKSLANGPAVTFEGLIFSIACPAEYGACEARIPYQRTCLHRLQCFYVSLSEPLRFAFAKPAFGFKVEHLPPRHTADTSRAREKIDKADSHGGIRMSFRSG